MKRYLILTVLSFFLVPAMAQQKTLSFDVNGLKVIFRPTQKETVSLRMYFRGGVMNYAADQAGIEQLTLAAAATCGTKNYSVHDYQELADEYGIDISGESEVDYGTIGMDCIDKYFDQGWNLFADAVMNPVFDPEEFQNTKNKLIMAIYERQSNPEVRLEQMSVSAMFNGSQYSIDPFGTEKTVTPLTTAIVNNYYHNQLLNKKRMFLVVAGKMTREELEKKISASFAGLQTKPYTVPVYDHRLLEGERLMVEKRPLATNYMSCVLNAPTLNSPDYYPFLIGINGLSGNLHYELRVKQGLSYAPGAKVKLQQQPYTSMYVSTTQPKKAYDAMIAVYKSLRGGNAYTEDFLKSVKKDHRDRYYRHQESASAIVDDLGLAEVLGGYELEENKVANINKVELKAIDAAINKYLKGAIWIYLGDEIQAKATFQ